MPENNEKVEDFISLWKKKMENETNKPSVIGETLDKVKALEQENTELRNKIKENIELITKTEQIIRNTIEENKRLKEQAGSNSASSQQNNIDLNNKILNLENKLVEKEVELRGKSSEIIQLKTELEKASTSIKQVDSEATTKLVEDLKAEISRKNILISEFETKINKLTEENTVLNQQLIEKMKSLPIDYVVPVEQPKPKVIRPQSTQPSSQTLEILCQDLQTDLNRYKKIVDKLNKEKGELEQALKQGGFQLEPEELKELKNENENLKNELAQIQESLKIKQSNATQTSEMDKKLNDLENLLGEKDRLIAELKLKQKEQPIATKGPMSDLVEELQNRINKLKITIEEKNKIIEELKAS
jgi:hypothetical protein